MIYRNRVKEALQTSGVALGTFIMTGSTESSEIAAASGFDFIVLDMEHGSFGAESLVNMIRCVQSAGSTPVVRLPDDSEVAISKALDAGAVGVLISSTSNAEQVKKIVKATRYAPLGTRGACPLTRDNGYGAHDWKNHAAWCNENVMVWTLIETVEGFRNLEEIVSIKGLDAVSFGAFDLSQSMGFEGQTHHPGIIGEIDRAIEVAQKNKVEVIIHVFESSPEMIEKAARRWVDRGIRIMTCMADRRILMEGFKEVYSRLATVR